jgi:hypothetical protein
MERAEAAMPNNELGRVRRSQNLNTYGPGAIIDFRTGSKDGAPVSAVAAGLEQWNEHAPPADLAHRQKTYEPRLQERLGVSGFRLPPVSHDIAPGVPDPKSGNLIAVRFPTWLQCPACHRLQPARAWDMQPGEPALFCGPCTTKSHGGRKVHVIPVRFIAACEGGHLDEFPWNWWVQHKKPGCPGKLYLKAEGGAGLGGLVLSCAACGAHESMQGCFHQDALKGLGKCKGRRPWLTTNDASCERYLRVFQRGASCLYFPVVASALDIPPFADRIQQALGMYWEDIKALPTAQERRELIRLARINNLVGLDVDTVALEVERRLGSLGGGGLESIRREEYRQFLEEPPVRLGEQAEFEVRHMTTPAELKGLISKLVQATRLREVRALRAFTRIKPPDPAQTEQGPAWAKICTKPKNWLPAIEVRGEGVFLELDLGTVGDWEGREEIRERAEKIGDAYAADWAQRNEADAKAGKKPPRVITPRFLLVHSLAHALIRQLGVECGYSTASLRERLYVEEGPTGMAGLLIYTATPDSDGTLGGLASQAEPERFARTFEAAIKAVNWCSSDPLCISGVHAFTEPTSLAACHACMLVPETSCEEFNRLLDRAMLVGPETNRELGYFHELAGT